MSQNNDELCHWKYIRKEKTKGGNFRYIYPDNKSMKDIRMTQDKIFGGTKQTWREKDDKGRMTYHEKTVKTSDKVIGSKITATTYIGKNTYVHEIIEKGKYDDKIKKAKNWLVNLFKK